MTVERRRTGIPLVEALAREVDELLAHALAEASGTWAPPVDLVACPERFHVLVDLPGVRARDITVSLRDRQLEVAGWKAPPPHRSTGKRYLRVERSSGRFAVRVELPGPVDPVRARASLGGGVLRIELPRIEDRRNRVHLVPITEEEP